MKPKPPVLVVDLFPLERSELLSVLRGLPPDAWHAPTVCEGWTVKDLAAHILADDLNNLSRLRDGFGASSFSTPMSWDELVAFINRQNEEWVRAARRLSPAVLVELLAFSGSHTAAYFRSLDPYEIGVPVSWAGPDPAPNWLHIAREYTERWMHQQQLRDAVGAPGLYARRLFFPVLDTFVYALPRAYQHVAAPDGALVRVRITGDAGGSWSLVRLDGRWQLVDDDVTQPASTITLDQDAAWRLFTKGLTRDAARACTRITGDERLGSIVLDAVAILA